MIDAVMAFSRVYAMTFVRVRIVGGGEAADYALPS